MEEPCLPLVMDSSQGCVPHLGTTLGGYPQACVRVKVVKVDRVDRVDRGQGFKGFELGLGPQPL